MPLSRKEKQSSQPQEDDLAFSPGVSAPDSEFLTTTVSTTVFNNALTDQMKDLLTDSLIFVDSKRNCKISGPKIKKLNRVKRLKVINVTS
jgi:hypothetical protein